MKTLVLHTLDGRDIDVPIVIEFEGSENGHTVIWWKDEKDCKHSETVKESPKEIKGLINGKY